MEITFANDQVIDSYEFELRVNGSVWAVTPTWTGLTMVSLDPAMDMPEGASCYLYMNGYRFDFWTTGGNVPFVVSTNFENIPFPLEGNAVFNFSEAMDPATFIVTFTGTTFDLTWNAAFTELTVDPEVALDESDSYTLRVAGKNVAGVSLNEGNFYLNTVGFQQIIIVEHNMEDNFPVDGNLEMTFSEAMNAASFEGNISLTMNGDNQGFTATWTDGITLVINPDVDFDFGANVDLYLEGMSADDELEFDDHFDFDVFAPADVFVVAHNIVDEEFPLDGNLEFTFNQEMDPATVDFFFEGVGDITGDVTWNAAFTVLTFDPHLSIHAATTYYVGIDGYSAIGGELDGGRDHSFAGNDYNMSFDTVGGLNMLYHNMHLEDGSEDGFAIGDDLVVTFDGDLDLSADGTSIVLSRTNWPLGADTQILVSYSAAGAVLTVDPDQDLTADTEYELVFTVFSTITGISTSETITFTTFNAPTGPVVLVTGFVHDTDTDDWENTGDFDQTTVALAWDYQEHAAEYRVYARLADMAKVDFGLIAVVANPGAAPVGGLIESVVSLAGDWADVLDSRDDDTPQTPFDGTNVLFKVTAVNGLGETDGSDILSLQDVVAPDADNVIGDDNGANADFSGADPADDHTVTVTFAADEYLDWTVVPVTTSVVGENAADPTYVVPEASITYEYRDMDGFTEVDVILTVDSLRNAGGDSVKISGLFDTSGNAMVNIVDPVVMLDTTVPGGVLGNQSVSADNSGGATPLVFDLDFVSTEVLDHDEVNAETFAVTSALAHVLHAVADADGVTTVTLRFTVPAGVNAGGEMIEVNGFIDLSGNTMVDAVEWESTDTTPVTYASTAQDLGSADNTGGGAVMVLTVTFEANENFDLTVDAAEAAVTFPGGSVYTQEYLDADTFVVTVGVAAGDDGTGGIVTLNGLTDESGNVQVVGRAHVLQ